MGSTVDRLESLLARGEDNALLRFSLGSEYLKAGSTGPAIEHLRSAVALDPDYSAAWKLLGKALLADGRPAEAAQAWRSGIEAAGRRGDRQAAKEMRVFLRRLER